MLQLLCKDINLLAFCISLQFPHNNDNSTFTSLTAISSPVHVFCLQSCSFKETDTRHINQKINKTKKMLYKALLNSCVQAKFLFCAAYSTKIFPLYPLRYELELQKISSYLTLPTHLCWDLPHLKGSSAAFLPFRDLDTTG